ncbi:MAG TPA: VCBS repeat-containing protein [Kofleriaceae bacterium]|nr:VCBS repeat-containing protein [Kofleriaceae bacterium]
MAGRVAFVALAACSAGRPPSFTKHVLDTAFRSEGVAVFDVDRDGRLDVVTDQFWYSGADFTPHEIRTPEVYDPVARYSMCDSAWGDDLDGDGWTDLVVAPFPTDAAYWYRNPGDDEHWTPYMIAPILSAGMETQIYVDLFGDGHRELVMGVEPQFELAYFTPGPDPTQLWDLHPISAPGFAAAGHFNHGLGAGDVDGDGKLDVLTSAGWFQQTDDREVWIPHAFSFGALECSSMFARDLDGDGLTDVICPHPHDYGIDWWQQQPDGSFVDHQIDDSISQMHSAVLADLDGDGVPELVSGKTKFAHTYDPGADDPSLLVYYELPSLERHVIDDDSGVGRGFTVTDLDGDGRNDIVISNKNGLFVFDQR